ncbi:ty3-gypsy retrotransposon protein [Cucumis melo var. makuwa]|uniref:Ty3-gypsy retrotransposon protein n=1 Tax=Cucumis melo var. makuwa TaxID=1194695 RepID=A0A5A7V2S2_CUCMM|nr:ty3-gypsy retrotransposon protein [Cucumis melo var. makuwa]
MASKNAAPKSSVASDVYIGLVTQSLKAGIVIKENPLYDNSDSASIEATMAEMERKINLLMKVVEK